MTHYQKLATLIFRIIGALFLAIAIFYGLISVVASTLVYSLNSIAWLAFVNFYWLPLLIIGIILFASSKKLGKFVCFDFDRFDD